MFHIDFRIDDPDLIELLKGQEDDFRDRSSIQYKSDGIYIEAKDIVACKATVNGLIKLIETYTKTHQALDAIEKNEHE